MTVSTHNSRLTSAEICRLNNWGPGTILVGEQSPKETLPRRIELTAIGQQSVLAIELHTLDQREVLYWLQIREWRPESVVPLQTTE